jgi:PEGA domain
VTRAGGGKSTARPRSGAASSGGGSVAHGGRTGATTGAVNSNDPSAASYGGYARPRGPHPAQGTAVPRDMSPLPPYWHGDYWDYYYWFPYYGPWGLYFYWDPYMWSDYSSAQDMWGAQPYAGQAYSGENGSLKLKVKPRTAQVYLDGYLVGLVDDFDGMFQHLHAPAGGHRLEIRQDGYKPLVADVMVQPDATTTFRGTLEPMKK